MGRGRASQEGARRVGDVAERGLGAAAARAWRGPEGGGEGCPDRGRRRCGARAAAGTRGPGEPLSARSRQALGMGSSR